MIRFISCLLNTASTASIKLNQNNYEIQNNKTKRTENFKYSSKILCQTFCNDGIFPAALQRLTAQRNEYHCSMRALSN